MILSFLVATKSLFPHVVARDIRIVKGSNYTTTHWSRSWKSYLISESKECIFSNYALIVMNQLPINHISNVAYPIHLRNQIKYNQDPIVASLRCYLYANCHYVVLNIMFYSSTVQLMQSTMTQQLINQAIFHRHIIHKVWPFALLATHLTTIWELSLHLHQPPRKYLPGWLCVTRQPWTGLV